MRVTVIIPTFNRQEFLKFAVESVLRQTFQDFEIIIVDDSSVNDVRVTARDQRIRYLRHERNMGEAHARNTGVKNAKTDYIAFLDDDDEWVPNKLAVQVERLEGTSLQVGGVYTGYTAIEKKTGKVIGQRTPNLGGNIYQQMAAGNVVGTPSTVLLRRMVFDQVGLFDKNIPYGLDYDMWIRISKDFFFECIPDPLIHYYVHDNQLSNNTEICIAGLEAMLAKYEQFFRQDRKAHGLRYWDLGYMYRETEHFYRASKALCKAITLDPFGSKNYVELFKVALNVGLGTSNCERLGRLRKLINRPGPSARK